MTIKTNFNNKDMEIRDKRITLAGQDLAVIYAFTKGERSTHDYPGTNDEIIITEIRWRDSDVVDLLDSLDQLTKIEELL